MVRYELDNHCRLMTHVPADIARHFVTFYGIDKTNCDREALVMELVTDDTGTVAKNLDANARPLSSTFFQTLERI